MINNNISFVFQAAYTKIHARQIFFQNVENSHKEVSNAVTFVPKATEQQVASYMLYMLGSSALWNSPNNFYSSISCIVWKIVKDIFTFCILSWIWLDPSRLNYVWNNNTYCLSYAPSTIPADVLATLRARASAGVVLTPKAGIFRFQH